MSEIAREVIELLEQYFAYIYPGFITVVVHHFVKARGTKFDKTTFIMSLVTSYVYILIHKAAFKRAVSEFTNFDYIWLLVAAILIPLIWHWICNAEWIENGLRKIGIDTSIQTTAWDYLQSRDKDKDGIVLKVFLDEKGLMYEGCLRYRESDPEKDSVICLSGYRRYIKENDKFVVKQDYNNDNSRWVLINTKEITRSEIKYKSEK